MEATTIVCPWTCTRCGESHNDGSCATAKTWYCPLRGCPKFSGKGFASGSAMCNHYKSVHSRVLGFCTCCNRVLNSQGALEDHGRKRHRACPHCQRFFKNQTVLEKHLVARAEAEEARQRMVIPNGSGDASATDPIPAADVVPKATPAPEQGDLTTPSAESVDRTSAISSDLAEVAATALESDSDEDAEDGAPPQCDATSALHSEFATPSASPVIAVEHLPVVPDLGDARADGAQGQGAEALPTDLHYSGTAEPVDVSSPQPTPASQIYAQMLDPQTDTSLSSDLSPLPNPDRLHCRLCRTEAVKPVATPCGHIFCHGCIKEEFRCLVCRNVLFVKLYS